MYSKFTYALIALLTAVAMTWCAYLYQTHYLAERMQHVMASVPSDHVDAHAASTCLNNAETTFVLLTSAGGVRWIFQDATLRSRVHQLLWGNVGFTGERGIVCPVFEHARRGPHWESE
jgi:hypothetical protein